MKIHEYQAKELLSRFGVPVLFSRVAFSAEEAGRICYDDFESKGVSTVVMKAQVHAGGRGKGFIFDKDTNERVQVDGSDVRGVNIIRDGNIADKAYRTANAILGNKLVTVQTGEKGTIVGRILIEEGVGIAKEFYAGIVLDRNTGRNTIMVSTEGGMEIEKVAAESPEKIIKEQIDPAIGFQQYQARKLGFALGLANSAMKSFVSCITSLAKAYEELDCSLLEINPLVLTTENIMIALDAKMNIDDSGLFRHPEIEAMRDTNEESPLELEAAKYDLNYIKLDGNVGCMVNGAGLAMATMDLIQLSGGTPANFLDVGGGANPDRIANAFRIMLSDENVRAVLINIFGGIVRCDKVADGIVQAMNTVEVRVPVIVRLDGTNAKEAGEKLKSSGLEFRVAESFEDAARLVTELVS